MGWLIFIGAPGLLWLLGGLANRGHGASAKALAFMVGSDNRLSLSRFQAFFWTLAIFGSYFAAMAIHTDIRPDAQWVQIPGALLALAGISIGSGVFSSLIAAVNGDESTARISSLEAIPRTDARFSAGGEFEHVQKPQNPHALLITGTDLGDGGKVRLKAKGKATTTLPILVWNPNGTKILVDVPDANAYHLFTVETPNGKLTYELSGTTPLLVLGPAKNNYEFADLFRDDKNPENLSLMKFQMFGWTIIAIFIYVYLFLGHLDANMATLPTLDPNIAVLTGISQAGYLGGKGVSNIQPNS
jgi:hypothetical protein